MYQKLHHKVSSFLFLEKALQARLESMPLSMFLRRNALVIVVLPIFLGLASPTLPVQLLLFVENHGHAGRARLEARMLRNARVPETGGRDGVVS